MDAVVSLFLFDVRWSRGKGNYAIKWTIPAMEKEIMQIKWTIPVMEEKIVRILSLIRNQTLISLSPRRY